MQILQNVIYLYPFYLINLFLLFNVSIVYYIMIERSDSIVFVLRAVKKRTNTVYGSRHVLLLIPFAKVIILIYLLVHFPPDRSSNYTHVFFKKTPAHTGYVQAHNILITSTLHRQKIRNTVIKALYSLKNHTYSQQQK